MKIINWQLGLLLIAVLAISVRADGWDDAQRQRGEWFRTSEGRRVVENVLAYQLPCGGWPKNVDMADPLDDAAKARLADRPDQATIDNGATVSQLRFLARAFAATVDEKARQSFLRGLDYLFAAQYDNGGWSQTFPNPRGYHARITFNDNAMANVLSLLQDVSRGAAPFDFVDADRRGRARAAVAKGIDCILQCQVNIEGRRTAWCAQHDEATFAPAAARAFEPVSLSGCESVGLVRFLMSVERPSPEVIAAVQGAVAWLHDAKIEGIRVAAVQTAGSPDRRVVQDASAPPSWARFYEIGTNRPIFAGRDGAVHYRYDAIERERRTHYAYYGDWPARLLNREYPTWAAKWGVR